MSKTRNLLSWVGIVLLGLINGVLEDIMFLRVLVEYMPPTLDLTGDLPIGHFPLEHRAVLAVAQEEREVS